MLTQVEVSAEFFPKGETAKGFILKTKEDFFEHFKREENKLLSDFSAAVKSKMPVESWDHIHGLLGASTSIAKINNSTPIAEAANILNSKETEILKTIANGGAVFINMNGGYHKYSEKTHKIIRYIGQKEEKSENVSFAKSPSLINLENDPKIEKAVLDFFKENNLSVSSVVCLRLFSKNELIDIFNRFKDAGGSGVYVYTTGNDLIQMKEYVDAVIESKLDKLIIEVHTEVSKEMDKIFEYAESKIKYFNC